ncbi:MAG TPA: hypothetical protein VLA74_02265 [Nitrososphaeraceae archaeon]|nr:hypothetical protein [Nitrososphaeraceae archaeon]
MMTHNSKKRMLVLSKNIIISVLLLTAILFIFLFSIIGNDILITVYSSIENTTQTLTMSNPDITSNFTNVQWKKFVNETIGISLEYPSHWEGGGTGREGYYHISPKTEGYLEGVLPLAIPLATNFDFSYGEPPFDNLEVLTRVFAVNILDHSSDYIDYEIIEKPNMEKYTIDGEKASTFSYKKIHEVTGLPDLIINVEVINVIYNGKFFTFEFEYPINKFDEEYITKIKDHMFNSIRWLN